MEATHLSCMCEASEESSEAEVSLHTDTLQNLHHEKASTSEISKYCNWLGQNQNTSFFYSYMTK